MNILKETFSVLAEAGSEFTSDVATNLYKITGLEDPLLLSIVAVSFLVIPIVWYFTTTFTENFCYIKTSALVITFSTLIGSVVDLKNSTFLEQLKEQS